MTKLPTGLLLATAFLTALLPVGADTANAATEEAGPVRFGMDANSIAAQKAAGVAPDYATFWIGPWTLKSGWGGPDSQLTAMKNAGVTPAIHFYYWGDDISPSCVENGCWSSLHDAQKTRAGWEQLGTQLTQHLNSQMGGAPVVVFLESEFNKGGIETYEPFDGYMAAMADKIHAAYPNAIVVLGFGNWGSAHWGTFDRAAAASDMVGIQGLRGSTRQNVDGMMTLYDGLLAGTKTLNAKFPGVPVMLTDIAVSSYPEPTYLGVQEDVLAEVLANLGTLKAHGVEAIIYRSWRDSRMDPANYYGEAESHWGLAWQSNGTLKPSGHTWVEAVKAERAGGTSPPPPPPPPPAIEVGAGIITQAEVFATKSAGGKQADGAADGGNAWNLWSNGHIAQTYNLTGSTDLTLTVRGTPLGGVPPHMDVYVGGAKVLSTDPGRTYESHRVTVSGQGATEVRIAFTNDAKTSTEDRNLLVDTVRLAPANRAPVASFTAATDGLSVQVDASASSDPDGHALTFAWAFGDGATATGPQAQHAYSAPGDHTITLTVSDRRATATASRTVTAIQPNRAPVAAFTATAEGLGVQLDASATSDADGDALSYAWDLGDGATATGAQAQHAYAAAGDYTVTLTVHDGEASSSATRTVTAIQPNRAPVAAFVATADGLGIAVDAAASSDADGDALAYAWDFGDGTTGTGVRGTHTYAAPGNYTVTLMVSDGELAGTASGQVTATQPNRAPVASFTATASKLSVATDASGSTDADGDALAYTWAWGDGTTSTGRTATHAYAKAGTYAIQLTVSDGEAAATASRTVTVTAPTTSSSSSTTTSSTAKATVTPSGNEWWIQAKVSPEAKKVEVKVGDGAWTALDKKSYGWAKSLHAPTGTPVTFRVTDMANKVLTTPTKAWLVDMAPMTATSGPTSTTSSSSTTTTTASRTTTSTAAFQATMTPKAVGNDWWVEVAVTANQPIAKVEARINGGAWVVLPKTDWGTYADTEHAPNGAKVVFRATSTTGATATSATYTWT